MQKPSALLLGNCNTPYSNRRQSSSSLRISSVDVDLLARGRDADVNNNIRNNNSASDNLLSWKDIVPLSMYTAMCLFGAIVISTYEDFDVTHTRPSPSTLRLPPMISSTAAEGQGPSSTTTSLNPNFPSWRNKFDFLGAATQGLGWAPPEDPNSFGEWYGTSAATLQWKPSYNEIMLQHRLERVPRWNELDDSTQSSSTSAKTATMGASPSSSSTLSKKQYQQAVLQLYQSLDELDELKLMADDYRWDDMKERMMMIPTQSQSRYTLPMALEYSMDVLKTIPSYYASNSIAPPPPSNYDGNSNYNNNINQIKLPNNNNYVGELPDLIGFDWGSCAWRHCGAKADAQEAIAELYSSVGMLEPFECRFVIDIVERSIRDVLTIVPDDLMPHQNGSPLQVKPYVPYVSQTGNDEEGMGIDFDYTQALSEVRVDLSSE
ncbi:hypothetical protein ACHAXR_008431 [Thalassiosira sp. AJA248-18]